MTSYGSGQQTPKSPIEGVKEMIAKKLLRQTSSDLHDLSDIANENEINKDEIALEKLQHFIEVGFLMDPKGFKLMDFYKEKTFDSVLAKHIFEF